MANILLLGMLKSNLYLKNFYSCMDGTIKTLDIRKFEAITDNVGCIFIFR